MREEALGFVVRVGAGFVSKSDAGKCRLITYTIAKARRFSRSDALNTASLVTTAFPSEKVFIARENHPDAEFNVDDPSEFIIAIGRKYLKAFKAGQAQTAFTLEDAARYTKLDAKDLVTLLSETWTKQTVYTAHEDTPFIAIDFTDRTADGNSKPDDDWRDASEE
jgi:hypothetical protein